MNPTLDKRGLTGRWLRAVLMAAMASLGTSAVMSAPQRLSEEKLLSLDWKQNLGSNVALNLVFRDEEGRSVSLARCCNGKPTILVLGYYECPMLCSVSLNGLVEAMEDMKWKVGEEFNLVNVSINPREGPQLAAAKKKNYLKRYGRSGAAAGWHFLTGDAEAIQRLADETGFEFAYDPVAREYAHPSGVVLLSPQGRISGYLFGVTYSPTQLYEGLRRAAAEQTGSPLKKFLLLCFHYNPLTGKYSKTILALMRILAAATVFLLALWIFRFERKSRRQPASPAVHDSKEEVRQL